MSSEFISMVTYRCRRCNYHEDSTVRADDLGPCPACFLDIVRREWSISFHREIPEHFNKSTGRIVRTRKQFAEQLKVAGDAYTARTGIDCNYVPVDHTDVNTLHVTGEGLDDTNRRLRAEGSPTIKVPGII